MDVRLSSADRHHIDPSLYTWTALAINVLCGIYVAALLPVLTLAGSKHVPQLDCGIWFGWQPLAIYFLVSKLVALLDTGDTQWDALHSVAHFVSINSPHIAALYTVMRLILSLALAIVDIVYLILNTIDCFTSDCTTDPTSKCCAEGALYAVTLIAVLAMAVTALAMFFLLLRMPWTPTHWLRDPAALRKKDDDLPLDRALANQVVPAGTVRTISQQ